MRKLILAIGLAFISSVIYAQAPNRGFEPMFKKVANKSIAWNELFDFFKPLQTSHSAILLSKAVWVDPCQYSNRIPYECPRISHLIFFKENEGIDTFQVENKFMQLEYKFTTNSRIGTDTITNIDTIRTASFSWKIKDQFENITKRELEALYKKAFARAARIISNSYGAPKISENVKNQSGDKLVLESQWPHANGVGTLGVMRLKYDKKKKSYLLDFSTDLRKKAV
jgi:hypothetical protein